MICGTKFWNCYRRSSFEIDHPIAHRMPHIAEATSNFQLSVGTAPAQIHDKIPRKFMQNCYVLYGVKSICVAAKHTLVTSSCVFMIITRVHGASVASHDAHMRKIPWQLRRIYAADFHITPSRFPTNFHNFPIESFNMQFLPQNL